MKKLTRIFALLTAIIIIIPGALGFKASAASSYTYYQTVKKDVPIWSDASSKSSKQETISKEGTVLLVVSQKKNSAGNLWYKLMDGNWVYSGNVKTHKHAYESKSGGICTAPRCGYEYPLSVSTFTESVKYIVTNKDGATIWSRPYSNKSDKIRVAAKGEALMLKAKVTNERGNLWFQLENGSWVYSGNVSPKYVDKTGETAAPTQQAASAQTDKQNRIANGTIVGSYNWDDRANGKADIWLVTQTSKNNNPQFDSGLWPKNSDSSTLCDLAAASMAISWLGYRIPPKDLAAINSDGDYYASWKNTASIATGMANTEITYTNSKAGTPAEDAKTKLNKALDNFMSSPDVFAPPLVHMPYATDAGHWVVIAGRNADGSYIVVDPSQGDYGNNGKKLNLVLTKADSKKLSNGAYTSTVDQVVQFYKN